MDTYVVLRDIKPGNLIMYFLIPGNKSITARCGSRILNPEIVAQYAHDYKGNGLPTRPQHVLKNVVLEEGEFVAYSNVTIKSFDLEEP